MLNYIVKSNFFRLNALQIFKMHVHCFDFDEDAHALHASVQKVPKANVCLNSRRCKILACRYHYRKAWYLIDL